MEISEDMLWWISDGQREYPCSYLGSLRFSFSKYAYGKLPHEAVLMFDTPCPDNKTHKR